ncbi:hypothetical protein EYF80_006493 [Liparis tanakae]|uniref:Uncharacterized protein n=1 Tax=Liparis tanakae TaxID=230148 RepID=A0A4Z2IYV4_9TELE|nr:hypothetical protein EYF80_006493 [Liparis tanakae]
MTPPPAEVGEGKRVISIELEDSGESGRQPETETERSGSSSNGSIGLSLIMRFWNSEEMPRLKLGRDSSRSACLSCTRSAWWLGCLCRLEISYRNCCMEPHSISRNSFMKTM